MAEKTEKRGGRRAGAGRPKGDSRLFSFRCSGELAERIGSMENRTEFINASLSRALDETEGLSRIGKVIKPSGVAPMHLPYFDQRVTAGFPIPLDNDERSQDIELLRMLCPHPEASYLIRVKGDSMSDVKIYSGDIVLFADHLVEGDGIYVINYFNDLYVKRLQFDPFHNKVSIISENRSYKTIECDADNENLVIQGKVISWIHKEV